MTKRKPSLFQWHLIFQNRFSFVLFFESHKTHQFFFLFFFRKLAPFSVLSGNESISIQIIACRSYFIYHHQYHHLHLNFCLEKVMNCFGKNFSYYKSFGLKLKRGISNCWGCFQVNTFICPRVFFFFKQHFPLTLTLSFKVFNKTYSNYLKRVSSQGIY